MIIHLVSHLANNRIPNNNALCDLCNGGPLLQMCKAAMWWKDKSTTMIMNAVSNKYLGIK